MTGTGVQTFSPNAQVTRAMAAQIIFNRAGQPHDAGHMANAFFYVDVPFGAWYRDAVIRAGESGIMNVIVNDVDGSLTVNAARAQLWDFT